MDRHMLKLLIDASRLKCTCQEEQTFSVHIQTLVDHFDTLYHMDTSHVASCERVVEGPHTIYSSDEVLSEEKRKLDTSNPPSVACGWVCLPPNSS